MGAWGVGTSAVGAFAETRTSTPRVIAVEKRSNPPPKIVSLYDHRNEGYTNHQAALTILGSQ